MFFSFRTYVLVCKVGVDFVCHYPNMNVYEHLLVLEHFLVSKVGVDFVCHYPNVKDNI
jgi:hypothetical protein